MGTPKLSPETDRAMICSNLAFNLELKDMLEEFGLEEGRLPADALRGRESVSRLIRISLDAKLCGPAVAGAPFMGHQDALARPML